MTGPWKDISTAPHHEWLIFATTQGRTTVGKMAASVYGAGMIEDSLAENKPSIISAAFWRPIPRLPNSLSFSQEAIDRNTRGRKIRERALMRRIDIVLRRRAGNTFKQIGEYYGISSGVARQVYSSALERVYLSKFSDTELSDNKYFSHEIEKLLPLQEKEIEVISWRRDAHLLGVIA